jgi:hypothetical protein
MDPDLPVDRAHFPEERRLSLTRVMRNSPARMAKATCYPWASSRFCTCRSGATRSGEPRSPAPARRRPRAPGEQAHFHLAG